MPRPYRYRFWLLATMLTGLFGVAALLQTGRIWYSVTLDQGFEGDGDQIFRVPFPDRWLLLFKRDPVHLQAATLQIRVNGGGPLLRPADPTGAGTGWFEYRDQQIRFAPVAGTPAPRSLEVRFPVTLSRSLGLLITLTGLAGLCAGFVRGFGREPGSRPLIAGALLLFAAAAFLRLTGLPPLILDNDSYGYLHPALQLWTRGELALIGGRQLGYPLLLYGLIATVGLDWLGPVQQLLLIAAAALILRCWFDLRPFFGAPAGTLAFNGLGLALLFLLLFYPSLIIIGQSVIAESCFVFASALTLFALLRGYRSRHGPIATCLWCLLAVAAGFGTALIKPHFAFAAVWIALLAAIRVAGLAGLQPQVRYALAAAVVALPAAGLLVPQKLLESRYDAAAAATFGASHLFCIHADLVVRSLERSPAPAAAGSAAEFQTNLIEPVRQVVREGRSWPILGFHADDCLYRPAINRYLSSLFGGDSEKLRDFYLSSFGRAVLMFPLDYARKVLRQVSAAAMTAVPDRPTWVAVPEPDRIDHIAQLRAEVAEAGRGSLGLARTGPAWFVSVPDLLAPAVDGVRWAVELAFPAVALIALGVIGLALAGRIRFGAALPLIAIGGVWLAETLMVAMIHSFDIHRYLVMQAPVAVLLTFATLLFAASGWGRRNPDRPPTA